MLTIVFQLGLQGISNAQVVSDKNELAEAINNASAGTEIVLADGTWTDVNISIDVEATENQPVVISAETAGDVFFEGNSQIEIGGAHIIFQGVIFRNPSGLIVNNDRIDPIISFRANGNECDDCIVTNIKIEDYNGTSAQEEAVFKWILVYGFRNEISYSSFVGKHGVGSIINHNRNDGEADRTSIHHNYFADRTPVGEFNELNDQDAIRLGNSSTSLSESFSEVYENYFHNFSGEIEIISNKCGGNKYFNNTFRDYQGSLTLRHGNNCEVYGNFFFAENNSTTAGIRVIGEGHKIYNNYIEGVNSRKAGGSLSGATGGINISNGRPNTALNGYFTVKDTEIVHNTFVNCDYAIRVGTTVSSNLTLPPENVEISNNVMVNSSSSAFLIQTNGNNAFSASGNITENGDWDLATNVNNNVVANSDLLTEEQEFFRVADGSVLINAGIGSFDYLATDILGGDRDTAPDAGAEEFGAAGERLPFTDADVGVNVGFGANLPDNPDPGVVASVFDEKDVNDQIVLYPNPAVNKVVSFKSDQPILEEVVIFDNSGKRLKQQVFTIDNQSIDLRGFESGVYLITIPSNQFQKLVIIN